MEEQQHQPPEAEPANQSRPTSASAPAPRRPLPPRPRPRSRKRPGLLLPLLLVGLVIMGFVGLFIVVMVAALMSGPSPVKVSGKSVLHLRISGSITAYTPPTPFDGFFEDPPLDLADVRDMIQEAGGDDRIEGIFLEVGPSTLSFSQLEDLRQLLTGFRENEKWIVSFGELWQEREYFLASVADEIYMPPEAIFNLDGFMSRTTYYNRLMAEYGVGIHVEAHGEFKSMADTYRYEGMTEPVREATRALLDTFERVFVREVAASRKLEEAVVGNHMDEFIFQVSEGVERGFLDEVLYRDEVETRISELLSIEDRPRLIKASQYWRGRQGTGFSPGGDGVAVIYATGAIRSGVGGRGLFGDEVIGDITLIEQLKAARRNPRVKAIVIRIDSPGGSQLASDVIWREVRLAAEDKPVYASMGGMAASGGYYIAMACDQIVAQPTTITGSIGVVSMRFDFEGLYEKFLLNVDVVKTGPSADFFDPARSLTPAEIEGWQRRTLDAYRAFVTKAAESRDLEYNVLEQVARGRVWSGEDAMNSGLVDHLGSLEHTIALAAEKAGLQDYQVLRFPIEDDYLGFFKNGPMGAGMSSDAKIKQLIPEPLRILADTVGSSRNTQLMAIAPYHYRID